MVGGLWHLTTNRANSASNSVWYGKEATRNYDTGMPTYGYITSKSISLLGTNSPKLTFNTWYSTETPDVSYDIKRVQITTNNGVSWQNLKTISGKQAVWYQESISLSSYIGKTIKIRFYFNSVDRMYNNYEGWYIDDIRITK